MTAVSVQAANPHWFDQGTPSRLDRMPLFGEALSAVAQAWTESLSALAGTEATFTFLRLSDAKVAGLAGRRGPDPVFVELDAPGWATAVALQFDRPFVAAVVEALFGGGDAGGGAPDGAPLPQGPLSAVETRIAEVVSGQAADALEAGFAAVLPSRFLFRQVQPKPDLALLGRPNAAVVLATLALAVGGATVEVDLIVPRSALDAFAETLSVLPADEPENVDPRWSEQLGGQLSRAPMLISAVVELPTMTLGDIARLTVGQVLALPRNAATDVGLLCQGRRLFRCDLGQSNGHHTVRIEEPTAAAPMEV